MISSQQPLAIMKTGGVRCERAGSYLRAISSSNEGAWKNKDQPKGIFQLQGGIQKYLESYGDMEVKEEQTDNKNEYAKNEEEDGSDKKEDASSAEEIATTKTSTIQAQRKEEQGKNTCLYRGKNFVFDPRRTDPIIGNGISSSSSSAAATHNSSSSSSSTHSAKCISTVGKCIICSSPHDDYDNGHAPVLEREVRCCRCRVLVLVCNDCRERVRCWGEEKEDEDEVCKHRATEVVIGGEDAVTTTSTNRILDRKDLFCGGSKCIDEGNVAEKVELTRF